MSDAPGDVTTAGSILGHSVLRREDPKILRGEAEYFDDLAIDGLVHVVFVRSTIAHATVTGTDITEAEAMPGVLAVYTAQNLALEPVQGFVMLPPVFSRERPTAPAASVTGLSNDRASRAT